ncbi:MAG: hypothetical protein A2Y78_11475 [Acidobacteria bacterium RBG_13_68_16]|nr:MAG: hypothetical protein A2Y78_11475 [Acidobacteria bacterium RBG_13_68_16]
MEDEEVRGYRITGYDTGNIQAARVAFAGDLAAVAVAFMLTPGSTPAIRARQAASFAMGRATNMSAQERIAVSKYLATGEISDQSLLNGAIMKTISAWRATVLQARNRTFDDFSGLSDYDQTQIQIRTMYLLGYLTKSEFESFIPKAIAKTLTLQDLNSVYANQRARFIAESSAVLAKYKVAQTGGIGEKAIIFLSLILSYAPITKATSDKILAEANRPNLLTTPSIGLNAQTALIAVKNALLAGAGA